MTVKVTMKPFVVCAAAMASLALFTQAQQDDVQSPAQQEDADVVQNPSLVTRDGNLNVRLPRDATMTVERRQTIDVVNMEDRLNILETQTVPMVAANARTEAHTAAFNATLTALDRLNSRIDTLTMQIGGINGQVTASVSSMESTVNEQLSVSESRITASTSDAIQRQATTVSQQAALLSQLTAALNDTRAALNDVATDHFYIQWGSRQCTTIDNNNVNISTLYAGWTYGTRHNYAGGGGEMQCMKATPNSQNGGVGTGGDSADMIFPVISDHMSYTGNRIPNWQNVPCARCMARKMCYLETSTATCSAAGYRRVYSGYMAGGHEGHHANNERVCIDSNRDTDWRYYGDWGTRIYPTIERAYISPRTGQFVVACHMCCQA